MLTKSDLASFRQCPRRLWLEKHAPKTVDTRDSNSMRRLRDGLLVGAKARELLGDDVIWPRGETDKILAAESARTLLDAAPDKAGVEIPLLRDGLYARADALIPSPAGYALQETKASSFPLKPDKQTPADADEHLLDDLAIQIWIMQGGRLPLARAELNLVNSRWRYPGDGDYRGLFRPLVVDSSIQERVDQVPLWIERANAVIAGPIPTITTGKHCTEPHSCAFKTHCLTLDPPGPEHPIELLPGPGKALARKLREAKGYTSLLDPGPDEFTGKGAPLYKRMQHAHRTGEAVLEPDSGAALAALLWPRYYFDFEGIDLALPVWAGVRPYEKVPFQWSCHIERRDGHFEHLEFLDLTGSDPSIPCIEAILAVIPPEGTGPIIVYSKTYESECLKALAVRHPQHAPALQCLIDRLVDLCAMVQQSYYHPAMRGSFSIKEVLPTIAPELDYGELGGITGGTAAQMAYLLCVFETDTTDEARRLYRADLLKYCKQDTWAMVEVAHYLERRGRPAPPL
jgi:hypothetical protein